LTKFEEPLSCYKPRPESSKRSRLLCNRESAKSLGCLAVQVASEQLFLPTPFHGPIHLRDSPIPGPSLPELITMCAFICRLLSRSRHGLPGRWTSTTIGTYGRRKPRPTRAYFSTGLCGITPHRSKGLSLGRSLLGLDKLLLW
jgi:hypothetical protein